MILWFPKPKRVLLLLILISPSTLNCQNRLLPDDSGQIKKIALYLSSYSREGLGKPLDDLTDIVSQIPAGVGHENQWEVHVFHKVLDRGNDSFGKLLAKNRMVFDSYPTKNIDAGWVSAESILKEIDEREKEYFRKGFDLNPGFARLGIQVVEHVKSYEKVGITRDRIFYEKSAADDVRTSETECNFSDYLQDEVHVFYDRLNGNGTLVFTNEKCSASSSHEVGLILGLDSDTSGFLPIRGGNMLVSTGFALIGRNALESTFAPNSDWCQLNGISGSLSRSQHSSEVSAILAKTILHSDNPKSIIWVGKDISIEERFPLVAANNCCIYTDFTASKSFQPFYHIDLFLSLIGQTATSEGDSNSIYYILAAVPDSGLQNFRGNSQDPDRQMSCLRASNDIVTTLQTEIRDVCIQIKDSVQELFNTSNIDLVVKVVEIPMPLEFEEDDNGVRLLSAYSYVNGLVSKNGVETNLYLPNSPKSVIGGHASQVNLDVFSQRLKRAIAELKNVRVKFITSDKYDERSGLRCLVKVIERK